MHLRTLHLLLTIALVTLIGCSRRERVSPDYVLVTPESLIMDGHPGTALRYKGKKVWPNVYVGEGKAYHDGIFVFSAPVPGNETNQDGLHMYDYQISPQLFAVRGPGPPVIISERIIAGALDSENGYHVWNLAPTDSGVRVQLYKLDPQTRTTRDVSWTDIQRWLQEAEVDAPKVTSFDGVYRVLPITRTNTSP